MTTFPWIEWTTLVTDLTRLQSKPRWHPHVRTDELSHVTSYAYDDYRRLKSVTPPVRGYGDNGTYTTSFYYGANGIANDYKLTDSNATWVKLPSGNKIHTVYDDNRRKNTVTAAPGTLDEATTVYSYDNVGNLRLVEHPLDRANVSTLYDERNRPYQITVGPSQTTTVWYDTSGHLKEIDRANGQVITYDIFDAMNRVTQQSATNTRLNGGQSLRTSYSYYPSGPANLLNTFQDPHLFGGNDQYTCYYDPMGRMGTSGTHWTAATRPGIAQNNGFMTPPGGFTNLQIAEAKCRRSALMRSTA